MRASTLAACAASTSSAAPMPAASPCGPSCWPGNGRPTCSTRSGALAAPARTHPRDRAERRAGDVEPTRLDLLAPGAVGRGRRAAPDRAAGLAPGGRGHRALPRRDGRVAGDGRAEALAGGDPRLGRRQQRLPARHPRAAPRRRAAAHPRAAGHLRAALGLERLEQQQERHDDARQARAARGGRSGRRDGTRPAVGPRLPRLPRRPGPPARRGAPAARRASAQRPRDRPGEGSRLPVRAGGRRPGRGAGRRRGGPRRVARRPGAARAALRRPCRPALAVRPAARTTASA